VPFDHFDEPRSFFLEQQLLVEQQPPQGVLVCDHAGLVINKFSPSAAAYALFEDHPLDACREPSALEGWTLEVLYCDPKGSRAFLRIHSTEGRGVRLCWELSNPKGPTGVPRSYETAPPQEPTVGLSLGPYCGPGGGGSF